MRDKATMVAYIAVKPTFPTTAPIFCLSLTGLNPKEVDAAPRPPGSPRLQGDSLDDSEWVERTNLVSFSYDWYLLGEGPRDGTQLELV